MLDVQSGPPVTCHLPHLLLLSTDNAAKEKYLMRSNSGLDKSPAPIARLYHSSAILLPDASVLIAGSNPNPDVNKFTIFPTEYRAEIFNPLYFSALSCCAGSSSAAAKTTVALLRGCFTTHAMIMGQRYLQLNHTFTVQSDGTLVLHVEEAPNPNVLQPGPAMLFVTVNSISSNRTFVTVGSGAVGVQPTFAASVLPTSIL
ncbi:hypothetical protein DXG01_000775 [Tephrocybe rancida]|nr:hypothetical protein DXG01_000775 [Tephrocybe rancida]